MKLSYNWLKSYIPDIPKADKVADLIIFHICEIESVEKLEGGDTVFDVKILPDRAHDLLSHYGFAREISGLLGLSMQIPEYKVKETISTDLKIEIESENCRRYMGRIAKGIKVGPSPKWMVEFLGVIGQRSINNIVDATNIVMFDLGQPIHAFDLAKLPGRKIVVKNARNNDELQLVGSEKITVKLKDTDIMIIDGKENLAIAGVKGGLLSGINDETTDILIEVANFDPVSVRKTARRLSLQTDASKRFENNLSPELCEKAMIEISALVMEMCPDVIFEDIVDVYPMKQEEKKISFSSKYISNKLGIHISDEKIEEILKNYSYIYYHEGEVWNVSVPYMRIDLECPQDFVEELGRVYGYDKVKPELPKMKNVDKDDDAWVNICIIKQKLIEDGYREIMTGTFSDKGDLEILASASDKNFLRTNLTDGLKNSLKLNKINLPLLDIPEVKIFEIGTVFTKRGEEMHVCFGDEKNITEMTLEEYIEEHSEDKFPYEIPWGRDGASDFLREKVLPLVSPRQVLEEQKIFKPWSLYPFIVRDIAVWIPEGVPPENLENICKSFGTELLVREPKLFDSFTKGGRTSYAYRLVFQSYDRTLTDEEISTIMSNITEKILTSGWEVR